MLATAASRKIFSVLNIREIFLCCNHTVISLLCLRITWQVYAKCVRTATDNITVG